MIVSFSDEMTRMVFAGVRVPRYGAIIRTARRKLLMLDAAAHVDDLRVPPGNHLERLRGELAGRWSIRINDQWRVVFRWADRGAEDVQIVDYH